MQMATRPAAKKRPDRRGSKRIKGVPNVKTLKLKALTERAAAEGITPLEYMLKVLRAPAIERFPKETSPQFVDRLVADVTLRLAAARFAAPYVHPRIATEIKVTAPQPGADKPIDVLELAKSVAFLLTMPGHRRTIDVTPATQTH
jgi:hypothetical protein